jgi:Holliday junction DNA helicase RuvA
LIGHLKGILSAKHPPALVIDVQGVGYEVEAPMSTFYELPGIGEPLTLLTHLVVREDAHVLYGFATEAERSLFRSLVKVSGVGAKMALAILSGISVEGFVLCVQQQDHASLVKVPGIGKKTAERLLVEMRDRIGEGFGSAPFRSTGGVSRAADPRGEAFSALVSLGYKPAEVSQMLKNIPESEDRTEEIIRRVLQNLARK